MIDFRVLKMLNGIENCCKEQRVGVHMKPSITEIFFPYLQAANEKARTIVEAEEILTTENAANATAEQPETAQADTTANSLISQAAAQDSTNNLLADEAAFKKANPLFSVLTPNIDRQSGQIIPTGSLIGYSHVKDTAR